MISTTRQSRPSGQGLSTASGAAADSAPTTATFESKGDFLRLVNNGNTHDFHWFWLYHNCSLWLHPVTKERIIDVPDIPLDIKPRRVELFGSSIRVVWPAQRVSDYPIPWLLENSYAMNHRSASPPANDVSLLEVDYELVHSQSTHPEREYARLLAERINKYGAVVVRNRGTDTESIIRELLPSGDDVWVSHFGRIEDLRTNNTTNQNTDQLGYTDVGIAPHTDMPFVHNPPSMQLLHGIQKADVGGESYLVDARSAALFLKCINPWAFDMLSTINVKFHRKQKNFEAVTHYPLIQTYGDHVLQIRYSYFTMVCLFRPLFFLHFFLRLISFFSSSSFFKAPFRVPFEWMRLWYEAYNAFAKILQDEKYQFRFLLQPGDYVLYSNRTMVHAREAFSGPRWVRGAYFDQEKVLSHLSR